MCPPLLAAPAPQACIALSACNAETGIICKVKTIMFFWNDLQICQDACPNSLHTIHSRYIEGLALTRLHDVGKSSCSEHAAVSLTVLLHVLSSGLDGLRGRLASWCGWGALQIGQVVGGDNPEEIKKQKAIKGLLNKITPEKFEKILSDIIAVGYETEETESGLIDQVHTIILINLYIAFPDATELHVWFCLATSILAQLHLSLLKTDIYAEDCFLHHLARLIDQAKLQCYFNVRLVMQVHVCSGVGVWQGFDRDNLLWDLCGPVLPAQ